MFEVATTDAHREAIARAHTERAAAFAAGIAWVRAFLAPRAKDAAPVASAA